MEEQIYDAINTILQDKLHISPQLLTAENRELPLTGTVFKLSGINLAYLFFEVEKRFQIRIDVEAVLHYEFSTIQKIAALVQERQSAFV